MKKKRLWLLLGILFAFCAWTTAQNDSAIVIPNPIWTVNKATSIGMGTANVYDTYLSPLEYKGNSYVFQHERVSRTHFFDNSLIKQQIFRLNYTSTENPAKNANEYSILGEYNLGAHYPIFHSGNFRLSAGGVWNLTAGVLYNGRNSNNPASAKAMTNLKGSAQLFYRWKSALFRWQFDIPFAGIFFSPEYRESYYEVSLGNHSGLIHFASLHNQRAVQSYLTSDFPVGNWTIRLGLQSSLYQNRGNSLTTHLYTHNFMVGLVSESLNLSGKRLKKNRVLKSDFYE
jgi:hypothetical protein